jgi:hypothetical protein
MLRVASTAVLCALCGCTCSNAPPADDASAGDAPSDASVPIPDWQDFLEDRQSARCEREVRCGSFLIERENASPEVDCHPQYEPPWAEEVASGVTAGRVTFDAAAAGECLSAIATVPCGQHWGSLERDPPAIAEPCSRVFVPAVPLGGTCRPHHWGRTPSWLDECAGDLVCPDSDACPATCAAPGGEGTPCRLPYVTCADGLSCLSRVCRIVATTGRSCMDDYDCDPAIGPDLYACVAGTCEAATPRAEGESCADVVCGEGLFCDRTETCVVRNPEGTPCAEAVTCDPGTGFACDVRNGVVPFCAADAPYCASPDGSPPRCSRSMLGMPCRPFFWEWTDDPCGTDPSLVCQRTTWTLPDPWVGNCMPRLDVGDPCTVDRVCGESQRCVGGRCTRMAIPGGACGTDVVCPWTHSCIDGTCTARPWLGDPCVAHQCAMGMCILGRCALAPPGAPCDDVSARSLEECTDGCVDDVCSTPVPLGSACRGDDECEGTFLCRAGPSGARCVAECR